MIYYRVYQNGRPVTKTTFIDHDDETEYRFEVLIADNGKLACVAESSEKKEPRRLLSILYDSESGKSWPRDAEGAEAEWRDRFKRVEREHPGFKMPSKLAR
jgi:hypothetical protein